MKTCCFIGHKEIKETEKLLYNLNIAIENLIVNDGAYTFFFGSASKFNSLCLEIVTRLKEKYPSLIRIYIRAEYEFINQSYENYLLESYDKTYFAKTAHNAGKSAYVVRNKEMINKSDICIFYYDENYQPPTKRAKRQVFASQPKSGTKMAFEYAVSKHKKIINILDDLK